MDNFTVLSIPEISNERQIWLIRTNGGLYYNDFTTNKYYCYIYSITLKFGVYVL